MLQLSASKLPNVSTTIFSQMTQLAQAHQAINLSQGFPDFPADPILIGLVEQYMKKGFNQYAPMAGMMPLKEEISRKIENAHQQMYHPETEITITAGGTQAIFTAIAAFIKKDDEVIIFEPAYDCYEPSILLFGGSVKRVVLQAPDFLISWKDVVKMVTSKTKMIIINNPTNPSAKVFSHEDLVALSGIVKDSQILVLSDEVYENMVFEGKSHLSVCRYSELKERSIIVASFGKLFHVTGWKIGYCAAPELLMNEFRKVHQYNVFSVNTPIQLALAEYMKEDSHYLELSAFYQKKRDFMVRGLENSRFEMLPCEGTYFLSVKYDQISAENDLTFAKELTAKHKVASIPFSSFYKDPQAQNVLRFCFAKQEDTLEQALEKLILL